MTTPLYLGIGSISTTGFSTTIGLSSFSGLYSYTTYLAALNTLYPGPAA
jgi:hypothetical protein